MRRSVRFTRWVLGLFMLLASVCAVQADTPNVLFVVNDPAEITFTPLDQLIQATKQRLVSDKTIGDRDVANFWEVIRDHGVPNAGSGQNSISAALVVPGNGTTDQGVLALKGSFDKAAVLDLIARRYAQHVNDHIGDARQKELGIGAPSAKISGFSTHRFVMPVRNRELLIVDMGGTVLFASQKQGDHALLEKTIDVLTGKIARKSEAQLASRIQYEFEPTAVERDQMMSELTDAYAKYRDGRMENRRGVRRFTETLRRVVVDKKVESFKVKLADLQKATFIVDRRLVGATNSKQMALLLKFQNASTAEAVKAAAVKHLVAEMKKPANTGLQLALQNPNITVDGDTVVIKVPLVTEQDQMQAFAVMATYAARGIMNTRQPPLVRRLRFVADQEAKLGRSLETAIHEESAATSFFSVVSKISLGWSSMKVRSAVKSCEDAYVDLTSPKPDVMVKAVKKLAEAADRHIDELDKQIARQQKKAGQAPGKATLAKLMTLRLQLSNNARMLVMTVKSPGFAQKAGPLDPKINEKLVALAKKSGMFTPTALARMKDDPKAAMQALETVAAGAEATGAVSGTTSQSGTTGAVDIPAGMTLEKAYNEYQAAVQQYTAAIASSDQNQIRQAYDQYLAKYQIWQALMEKQGN